MMLIMDSRTHPLTPNEGSGNSGSAQLHRTRAQAGRGWDPDLANNTAPVTLAVSGAGGSAGEDDQPGEDGGTGGGLPVTGSSTALVAGIGVVALVAGIGAFLFSRRRRVQFTSDS